MRHATAESFRTAYAALPADIRDLADKSFALLKSDPRHPSLHFKKVGRYWSVRVGKHYRALARETKDGFVWVTIVRHKTYDRMI